MNLKEIQKLFPNRNIVYLTYFGSKLYGTNNENSDTDIKGIFIPGYDEIILQKFPDTLRYSTGGTERNTKYDVDIELYSIYKFFNLLKKGETGAIDLLFSMFRKDTIIYQNSEIIDRIKENYKLFLSKNMNAFIGYCVNQAKKYGIKGSRYYELLELLKFFEDKTEGKIKDYLSDFELSKFNYLKTIEQNNVTYISVLGKLYTLEMSVSEFKEHLKRIESSYGKRAKLAKNNVDWKALSHAVRVIDEVYQITTENFLKFPLYSANYIKNIKQGKFKLEEILKQIEEKLKFTKEKLEESDLPHKVDLEKVDDLLKFLINLSIIFDESIEKFKEKI